MSLGTIKNRHQKAVKSSPFARKLAAKKKLSLMESTLPDEQGLSRKVNRLRNSKSTTTESTLPRTQTANTNLSRLKASKESIQFRTGRSRAWSIQTKSKSEVVRQKTLGSGKSGRKRKAITSMYGINLGDYVECIWKLNPAYGRGQGRFVGTLENIRPDDNDKEFFFTLRDKFGVVLDQYTPLCKLRKVKRGTK